jgi:hypothetical protein
MLQEEPDTLTKEVWVSSDSLILLLYIFGHISTQEVTLLCRCHSRGRRQEMARLTISGYRKLVVKFAFAQRRYGVSAVLAMADVLEQILIFEKEVANGVES